MAERSSRRHTRSPGEAGGGRSDLCHDNDEPDPVNRRTGVGDNFNDLTAKELAGAAGLRELGSGRLSSGNEQRTADFQQRKAELCNDWQRPQGPRRRHIEGRPGRSMSIVLEALVNDGHVGELKLRRSGLDPVQPSPLRIDEGERGRPVGNCERESGKSGTGPEIGPALPRPG